MTNLILTNAFSLNMLSATAFPANFLVTKVTKDEAAAMAKSGFISAVGHADTAAIFSGELGLDVPANRATIAIAGGETLLIGQYRGPRLAEGVKVLPEGATIEWMVLTVS